MTGQPAVKDHADDALARADTLVAKEQERYLLGAH